METKMIDKLFLELSQVTKAKTAREMTLESHIAQLVEAGRMLRAKSQDAGNNAQWDYRTKAAIKEWEARSDHEP